MDTTRIAAELKKSERTIVVCKNDFEGDAFCAALGLHRALKDGGKTVQIICIDPIPPKFSFLGTSEVGLRLNSTEGSIAVRIKTPKKNLSEMWYEESEDGVVVHIEPSQGAVFRKEDVSLELNAAKPTLIVAIGAATIDAIRPAFSGSPWLFEVPIINVDNSVRNNAFGEYLALDLKATSRSEIVCDLLEKANLKVGAEAATALLTGIVAKTNSFQSTKTSPATFARAAQLVEAGGRQQDIIRHLYKTKTFAVLKLLGKAFGSVKMYPEIAFASARVQTESALAPEDINALMEEIVMTLSDANIISCAIDTNNQQLCFIYMKEHIDSSDILPETGFGEVAPGLWKKEGVASAEQLIEALKSRILNWLKFNQQV